MGTKGISILGGKAEHVVELLQKAYADEWLAYYQYWLGAKIAKGPMREGVMAELVQHAADELRHATMVADRIIQLGGTPLLSPTEWDKWSTCGYEAPEDPHVTKLLEQNVKGEQCAIAVYNAMLKETRDVDPVTYNMAVQILQDEVMHEEDLQALQEDIELMLSDARARA